MISASNIIGVCGLVERCLIPYVCLLFTRVDVGFEVVFGTIRKTVFFFSLPVRAGVVGSLRWWWTARDEKKPLEKVADFIKRHEPINEPFDVLS